MRTMLLFAVLLAGGALFAARPAAFSAAELTAKCFDAACDVRMDAWRERIRDYRPDYSDSTKDLLPPEGNRLDKPFAVVKNGKPACEVILSSESARPCLEKAAEEFVRYVKEITGVELPIFHSYGRIGQQNGLNKLCFGKRLVLDPEGWL